jgi:multidrug efflux pump subunit AcrA (membrane-fusion protein)
MSLRNTLEEPEIAEHDHTISHVVPAERAARRTRRMLLGAAIGLAVMLAVYLLVVRGSSTPAAAPAAGPVAPAAPVAITTVAAVERELPVYLEASGSLTPYESTDVAPEVAGQVVSTPVDAGSFISQGAVLARLDDRDARLRVEQAEANVQQAEAALRQARASLGLQRGEQLDPSRVAEV